MERNDFIWEWLSSGTVFSTRKDRLLIGWGKKAHLKEPHSTRPSFYFPDFFLKSPTPWFVYENVCELSVEELLVHLSGLPVFSGKVYSWHNPHQILFNKVFDDILAGISQGKLKKAVPFVVESVANAMDQPQLMKSLRAILNYFTRNPAHVYGFWDEHEGMLGATPEVLFQQQDEKVLQTMACAGTTTVKDDNAAFLSDTKELDEHNLVVQGITESLRPYGCVKADQLQLLKLSRLVHLATPLSVDLRADIAFEEIVKALHPTPAVGAFPKIEGKVWLENYQKHMDRLRYGAPAGYYLPEKKQSHCLVAIRNVQWNLKGMQIAAGCGIVADSRLENEWAEINLKIEAIKEILAL